MWRSRSVTAARLRQNTAKAPARPAPRISISLLVASAAMLRTAWPAMVVAARRRRGAITVSPRRGEPLRLARLVPTTKVPRKEAEAEHGRQRPERAGLHRLDQRIARGLAHLRGLLGQPLGCLGGAIGIFVDEVLGRLDRVVDRLLAARLDGAHGA